MLQTLPLQIRKLPKHNRRLSPMQQAIETYIRPYRDVGLWLALHAVGFAIACAAISHLHHNALAPSLFGPNAWDPAVNDSYPALYKDFRAYANADVHSGWPVRSDYHVYLPAPPPPPAGPALVTA